MQVAILAGGLATRLGELTKGRPKSLLEIHGKPFLEYQLEGLRKQNITDIVLCLGHLGQQIKDYLGDGRKCGVSVEYSEEDKLLGTAGALKKAEPLLDDCFFTLYGDSYLFLNYNQIMAYFTTCNKLALMTVYKNYNRYDRSNTAIEGNLVARYTKNHKTEDMIYIDYGANLFRKKTLEMIPAGQYYSLEDLFSSLVAQKQLLAFEVKERFYEIGSLEGVKEFERYVEVSQ